jgi:endonuclease/exonuclease/phosphatase family metal-dependent hydrolase
MKKNIIQIILLAASILSSHLMQCMQLERANIIAGHLIDNQSTTTTVPMPAQHERGDQEIMHPIWHTYAAGKTTSKKEMLDQYTTLCKQLAATHNPKIPAKSADICRIATYNVHFWKSPYGSGLLQNSNDFNAIINTISQVNADVLILQEVRYGIAHTVAENIFKKMGYQYIAQASNSPAGVDKPGFLYNCILSKYPIKDLFRKQYVMNPDVKIRQNPEQRSFAHATVQLPNNKTVSVYGTHLEVRPIIVRDAAGNTHSYSPETVRKTQLQELTQYIREHDTNNNIIIGADFNNFRCQDLQCKIGDKTLLEILQKVWPNVIKTMKNPKNQEQAPTSESLDYLVQEKWIDSFEKTGSPAPSFTTWSGIRVDFLFLNPTWNFPLKGSSVFYDSSSDHIPVIMDIDLSK